MKQELEKQLEELKAKHKDVFVLTVGDVENNDILYGFFKKPTFNEFRQIYPLMTKGDDLLADKRLLETCWLGGDSEILDVDNNLDIFLSIKGELGKLIELKLASLKKK